MIAIPLGLITAVVYGFADFFGAIASRKIRSVAVTFFSAVSGLVLILTATGIFGAKFTAESVGWGIAGGVLSAIAINALYAALAIGPISIISPMTAVLSAVVPAVVGLSLGEQFSGLGWLAIAAILVAVVLVGFVPGEAVRLPSAAGLSYGLIAGVGIGFVMVALDAAPADSGIASVVVLRSVSSLILGLSVIWSFHKKPNAGEIKNAKSVWAAVVVAGLFDSTANLLFTWATRIGELTVVSVLTALYPLGTILLARLVLKEKVARTQLFGIFLALGASALLAFTH